MSLASQLTSREQQRRVIARMVAHRLFHRMATRQGIDLASCWSRGLDGPILEALTKCERCAKTETCRDWLQSDRERASYVGFCPNAMLIEACRIIDPNAPPLDVGRTDEPVSAEPTLADILAEPIVKLLMASAHLGAARPHELSAAFSAALAGKPTPCGCECAAAPEAALAKDSVMPEQTSARTLAPIAALRQEHRNMATLLRALEWQVTQFENGNRPDYDVVAAVLDYFQSFPDIYHHPKEELIFARLEVRDRESAQRIGDLGIAHQDLADRAREFATALRAVLDEAEMSRAAFARWARGFIDLQRRHIDMEEQSFFPAAATALTAQDWTDLGARMTAEDDPLLGEHVGERFEQLRQTILGWQAQDQAIAAEQ